MTLAELRAVWAARDDLYASWRHDLGEASIESVRAWRLREVNELPSETERTHGRIIVASWEPPRGKR